VLEIDNIIKSFGPTKAVIGVSCSISRGEIFGIVGPDGTGKSTLLRIIAAVMKPDSGTVTIEGKSAFDDAAKIKKRVAYMPQKFGLYEDLTVEENIYFFGRIFSVPSGEIKNRLPRLYGFSGLEPFKDRLAGKLSGGMKQKLGLACCLVHEPEILLLDEPTNGVDPVSRREFWKILYELLSERVTIIVSTAYLDEAERCNRVAFMFGGEFMSFGTPMEIKSAIADDFFILHTDNPLAAYEALKESGICKTVVLSGTLVKTFMKKSLSSQRAVRAILKRNKIQLFKLEAAIPSLEDCFLYMVKENAK